MCVCRGGLLRRRNQVTLKCVAHAYREELRSGMRDHVSRSMIKKRKEVSTESWREECKKNIQNKIKKDKKITIEK